ncbi:MAG TPA: helix-turn-helix domain-containing protein [Rhizobacter sp.]
MPRGRRPKLDAEQKDKARWLYKHTSMSIAAIARRFDVSDTTIARAIEEGPRMPTFDLKDVPLDTPQQLRAYITKTLDADPPAQCAQQLLDTLAGAFEALYDKFIVADNARHVAEQTVVERDQQLTAARTHVDTVIAERDALRTELDNVTDEMKVRGERFP